VRRRDAEDSGHGWTCCRVELGAIDPKRTHRGRDSLRLQQRHVAGEEPV